MISDPVERKQIINSADEADVRNGTPSPRIHPFPLLESIYPPGSTESEKVAYLLSLFRMALQPEDDL
jgi:hypothetical protein